MSATEELPPRPDPWTGLPVPPPAPGPRRAPPTRRMPTRPQPPPPGRGPVLAGKSGRRRDGVVVVVGSVVVLGAYGLVTSGSDAWSSPPPAVWAVLGVVALIVLAWARSVATDYLAVGADWLQSGRSWVDLYELVEVKATTAAYGQPMLRLRDTSGRQVSRHVRELRADPLMWDLIHLGTRWSRTTHGLRINRSAEQYVGEDMMPAGALLDRRARVPVDRVVREAPDTADLPPRPDPWTLHPLPPAAPWSTPGALITLPRRPQDPPAGRGPLVAGRSGTSPVGVAVVTAAVVAVVALVLLAVGLTVGLDWFGRHPIITGLLVSSSALLVSALGVALPSTYSAAGADWAADERSWVDLYDLAVLRAAPARWWVPGLELVDGSGRRVVLPVRELRDDPLLGRLVHLGIRWSRALNVVEVDDRARALIDGAG